MAAVDIPHFDLDAYQPDETPMATFTFAGESWKVRSRETMDAFVIEAATAGNAIRARLFFQAVVAPDQVDAFLALLDDPEKSGVNIGQVQFLHQRLVETISGRPTQRSGGSGSGRTATSRTSGGVSSSAATPRRRRAS
jgi:hypothetical protein